MTFTPIAFAVPGDITTMTGGYIYDRRLMDELRGLGHDVQHIELPASFPNPSDRDTQTTLEQLSSVAPDRPIVIDGLAFGAIPTADLAQVKSPLIALIHHPLAKENGLNEHKRERFYRMERDNLARVHHVIVPSPHTARILSSQYAVPPQKITIARPGTDRIITKSASVQPPLILSVGIQAPRKGHDILLKSLSAIKDLAWTAVVVGSRHDMEHAKDLTTLRDQLKLGDRVEFAGQVTAQHLAKLYQDASLFALATRYEGYGIVFDEAMANGLPIVSCAVGAVPDTVPLAAGILVEPDASEKFGNALRNLLTDPAKRENLAQGARLAGQTLPSWEDTARLASGALRLAIRGSV